jgi:predicted ATPase
VGSRRLLLGRDGERSRLLALETGGARLVTITGAPGAGRTSLALAVAEAGAGRALVVELAQAGVPAAQVLRPIEGELASGEVLLVLDDADADADVASLVRPLLASHQRLTVLATARAPLGLEGEVEMVLPPLDSAAATELFARTAGTGVADGADAAELCAGLRGLPAAIELVAAGSAGRPPSELLAALPPARDAEAALEMALDWSLAALDEATRSLPRRLSILLTAFTAQAAAPVALQPDVLEERLEGLFRRRLLDRPAGGKGAYRVPVALRAPLLRRLEESGEADACRERHARWFLALGSRAESALTGPEQAAWVERLEAAQPDLRAALAWCRDHDPEAGLALALGLRELWDIRGRYAEGRAWLEQVTARAGAASPARPRALGAAAALALREGDREGARSLFRQSLAASRETGDRAGAAYALQRLGFMALLRDDGDEARASLEESLAAYRGLGDRRQTAVTLSLLGNTFRLRGDQHRAEELFTEALSIFREVGARRNEALTLANLANLARIRGDHGGAQSTLEESLAGFREIGDRRSVAWTLANLGNLARVAGDRPGAWRSFRESLAILREIRYRPDICFCLTFAGVLAVEDGRAAAGAELMAAGQALRDELSNPLDVDERADLEAAVAAARAALGEAGFAEAWARGASLGVDAGVRSALDLAAG